MFLSSYKNVTEHALKQVANNLYMNVLSYEFVDEVENISTLCNSTDFDAIVNHTRYGNTYKINDWRTQQEYFYDDYPF